MHDMIDKAVVRMKSDGWKLVEATGFIQIVGPLWEALSMANMNMRCRPRTSTTTAAAWCRAASS